MLALLLILLAPALAQPSSPPAAVSPLASVLTPGMTVWVTDTTGREQRMRVVDVTATELVSTVDGATRRFAVADVRRVTTRISDSPIEGALIGAAAAVASGLTLCRATEPWRNCIDDVGPMARIGAVGAGIGIVVDALIRGRQTVYETPTQSPVVGLRWLGRGRRGGALTVWF
jgi:hypothetical protein